MVLRRPEGIARQSRPMPLIILADTSGSMRGSKISNLNQALRNLVQDLIADEQTSNSILFSLITFDDLVKELIALQPVTKVKIPELSAKGQTSLGQAFRMVLAQLSDKQRIPEGSLVPTIVLASDGQPTDGWQQPLEELKKHRRAGQAVRLALAIGDDADMNVLQQFVTSEFPVQKADQPDKIKTFFRYVSQVSMSQSKSQGQAALADRTQLQKTSEIERLVQKYPRLSKELIQRHVVRDGPRVGRTTAQKEHLLKVLGVFEEPGKLSETLDEQLHRPDD